MVETGGVLFGRWGDRTLVVQSSDLIDNQARTSRLFRFPASILTTFINRRDFVGFFHTHRYFPNPSLQDCLTMRRLTKETDLSLVLGIKTRQLTLWLFKPGKLIPHLIKPSLISGRDLVCS